MRRDWSGTSEAAAAAKGCQCCGRAGALQRAHVIGRARDGGRPQADDVAMLCPTCHLQYDAHQLDLWPFLTDGQKARAARVAGGPGLALRRIMGRHWRNADGRVLDERLKEVGDGGAT